MGFKRKATVMCSVVVLAALGCVVPAYASNYSSGTYGSCLYNLGCTITLASSGTVSLPVVPTGSGSCTVRSDAVTVTTSSSAGFTLQVENATANSAMAGSASNTLPTTTATAASPQLLTANSWGYRVDNIGGFGAGPTTTATNAPVTTSQPFARMATSGAPQTIRYSASAAASGDTTSVWYGVCANASLASDTYTTQVLYTAVTN